MTSLKNIKDEFGKYLQIKDKNVLDLILAIVIGNTLIDSGSLWLFLIGASSSGKTSLTDPLLAIPSTYFCDDVSPKTFLSGFRMGGKFQSLLDILNKKTVVFSDFSTILSKNQEARGEILAQFRRIYDGKMDKATGTGQQKWSGKIGVIAAATPDLYNHLEVGRSAGERFMYYCMSSSSDKEMLLKQRGSSVSPSAITEAMKPLYYEYVHEVKDFVSRNGMPEFTLTPEQYDRVENAAIFCVKSKATIRVDFKTGTVAGMPVRASAGRDNRAFGTLLRALQIMDSYEQKTIHTTVSDERIALVERCAYSAISTERRKILEVLADNGGEMTSSAIGATHGVGLPKDAVDKFIAPLHAVGLINKNTSNRAFKWFIGDKETREFIIKVSADMREDLPPSKDVVEGGGEPEEPWESPFQAEIDKF